MKKYLCSNSEKIISLLRVKLNELFIQAERMKLFACRSGFVRLGPRQVPAIEPLLAVMPYIGFVAVVMHPTVAFLFDPKTSFAYAAVATALLLPACRRIVIAPAIAVVGAGVMIGIYHKSLNAVLTAIAAYALFWLITYESKRFYQVFLGVNFVAGILAILQFLIPSETLNLHASAESMNRFIDQYRPTSISFAQVLYVQLLLMSLPMFLLVNERRGAVWALFGVASAVTGSTAGLIYTGLAVLMGPRGRGHFTALGYFGAILFMLVFYPERVAYNFSAYDVINSVMIRASPPADASGASAYPTLTVAIEFLAVTGVMFMGMALLRSAVPIFQLVAFVAALGALVIGQMLHLTIGSLYFSLYFATIAALEWRLVCTYFPLGSHRQDGGAGPIPHARA